MRELIDARIRQLVTKPLARTFWKVFFRPGWCGSVDWVLACKPEGPWFDSQLGHMLGLPAKSPVGGFQPHIDVSLLLFPPPFPSLNINKFLKISKKFFKRKFFYFYKVYFIDYCITDVPFFPSPLLCLVPLSLQWFPLLLSSCPWVCVNSLASPSPVMFLTSPCPFFSYPFMLLNPYTSPPILLLSPPSW